MPRAALDGLHLGVGHELQHVARLQADVLHAQVARHLVADLAEARFELGCEQTFAVAQHQVFERIEEGLRHAPHA